MDTAQEYYQTPGHVFAAGLALSILSVLAVSLRFWTRKKQSQPLKMDDWLMLPATFFTLGIGISMIYGVAVQSLAYRMETLPEFKTNPQETTTPQFTRTTKIQFVFIITLPLALGATKASFLFFYKRIFAVAKHGAIDILLISFIIFVALWTFGFFFVTLFECRLNFWANWGSVADLTANCIETLPIILSLCITDFVADLVIISTPIFMVSRLNLSTSRKVAVCVVFLLGIITVAASLTRLVIMARHVAGGGGLHGDSILSITGYIYWGMVECSTAILAACLPTLQYFLNKDIFLLHAIQLRSQRSLKSIKSIFQLHAIRTNDESKDGIHVAPAGQGDVYEEETRGVATPQPVLRGSQERV